MQRFGSLLPGETEIIQSADFHFRVRHVVLSPFVEGLSRKLAVAISFGPGDYVGICSMNCSLSTPIRQSLANIGTRHMRPSRNNARGASKRRTNQQPVPPHGGGKDLPSPKLLCIDDDPELCRTLEMRLSKFRIEVLLAFFGTQGYWEAITDQPDLILMDVRMPNGDGRFVLQSLRQNKSTCSIPVIALTGMRDPRIRQEMLSLGADSYLQKPIEFQSLLHEMRRYASIEPIEPRG